MAQFENRVSLSTAGSYYSSSLAGLSYLALHSIHFRTLLGGFLSRVVISRFFRLPVKIFWSLAALSQQANTAYSRVRWFIPLEHSSCEQSYELSFELCSSSFFMLCQDASMLRFFTAIIILTVTLYTAPSIPSTQERSQPNFGRTGQSQG